MDTLYLARYLVPITSAPLEGGALVVRHGQIIDLGTRQDMTAAYPRAAVVDFGDDSVLLPPLTNAHCHLELTHFPRWAEQTGQKASAGDFVDWVLNLIRVKRKVERDALGPSLAAGIRAALKAGTGAVGDVLTWAPARSIYHNAPLYGRLYLETLGRDPLAGRRILQSLAKVTEECLAGRLRVGISPHSPYTLSSEYLAAVIDFARRHSLPLAIHLAESPAEVDFLQNGAGPIANRLYPFVGWEGMVPIAAHRSPVSYLAEHGGLLEENLLVHGVQVDGADCEAIARAGASVVLCPRSNERLGVGRAPVELYLKAGVNLALGTDSLASNDSLSIWDEMAFAYRFFDGQLSPDMLLRMATRNGACAVGLCSDMGSFAPRMGAHFQVLRLKDVPRLSELPEYLVSPGRTQEVRALYLAGRDVLFALDPQDEVC